MLAASAATARVVVRLGTAAMSQSAAPAVRWNRVGAGIAHAAHAHALRICAKLAPAVPQAAGRQSGSYGNEWQASSGP